MTHFNNMHHAIKKAARAILWVVFTLFCVVAVIGTFGLAGCVSQEVVIGPSPTCIGSQAKVVLGQLICETPE